MGHPYDSLTPDRVVDCLESIGLTSDLRLLALNSYENRVYQVGIEDSEPVILKFYRAERWTDDQILEEHAFAQELVDHSPGRRNGGRGQLPPAVKPLKTRERRREPSQRMSGSNTSRLTSRRALQGMRSSSMVASSAFMSVVGS